MVDAAQTGALFASLSLADLGLLPDRLGSAADMQRQFRGVATLDAAGPDELSVFAEGLDVDDLAHTRAGGCFVSRANLLRVPPGTLAIVAADPVGAFSRAAARFASLGARMPTAMGGIHPRAVVAADVFMESGVTIGAGAVIGATVQIGAGTIIGAYCVVDAGVTIGRSCRIGDHVTIGRAVIGDRVHVGSGARLGLVATTREHEMSYSGRLIVQDDARIGANAAIERGVLRDTIVGEAARVAPLAAVPADALVERFATFVRAAEMVSMDKIV